MKNLRHKRSLADLPACSATEEAKIFLRRARCQTITQECSATSVENESMCSFAHRQSLSRRGSSWASRHTASAAAPFRCFSPGAVVLARLPSRPGPQSPVSTLPGAAVLGTTEVSTHPVRRLPVAASEFTHSGTLRTPKRRASSAQKWPQLRFSGWYVRPGQACRSSARMATTSRGLQLVLPKGTRSRNAPCQLRPGCTTCTPVPLPVQPYDHSKQHISRPMWKAPPSPIGLVTALIAEVPCRS
mmetsp:Transcript_37015/g.105796  ORF Transcript_37015/g.105796 Transcript_37015/m.105796 type:complete len:244 (+) Transcript_37015:448-1179(+)